MATDGKCAEDGCPATYKMHKYGQPHGQVAGWYFRKDGKKAWCRKHTPDWVTYWRERKARRS